ncbi:hypothetical protein IFM89_027530 [Coptis chinensis]|uniref:Uncharacterized protein n=1 Tax=Coptis chinensis TaxID=261450 RepID=A0A835HML0_9MAGN|nr:hypothetical protein IFM89_027530 [Coptis chinensis]
MNNADIKQSDIYYEILVGCKRKENLFSSSSSSSPHPKPYLSLSLSLLCSILVILVWSMAQVVNLRPTLNYSSLSATRPINSSRGFCPVRNPEWKNLQLKLNCKGRYTCLFSNNRKGEEQARNALESALGGKRIEFEKWDKEIQKREEMGRGGGAGGGGWFGSGGWFGGFNGDHFWEEAQQASLVVLILILVYLVIAKGEVLLAVLFNPLLFAMRGVRNGLAYIKLNILRKISPAGTYGVPDNTQKEEILSNLSAKESVVRKWASD